MPLIIGQAALALFSDLICPTGELWKGLLSARVTSERTVWLYLCVATVQLDPTISSGWQHLDLTCGL